MSVFVCLKALFVYTPVKKAPYVNMCRRPYNATTYSLLLACVRLDFYRDYEDDIDSLDQGSEGRPDFERPRTPSSRPSPILGRPRPSRL